MRKKTDWLAEIEDRHYAGKTTTSDVSRLLWEVANLRRSRSDYRLAIACVIVTAVVLGMIAYATSGVRVGIGGGF